MGLKLVQLKLRIRTVNKVQNIHVVIFVSYTAVCGLCINCVVIVKIGFCCVFNGSIRFEVDPLRE